METNHVPIKKIRIDGGTQMRAVIDDETVAEYAERYRTGAKMPPLVVFYDGADYWLADGFHRVQALLASETPNALCEIHSGTQRDAVLYACGANAVHGIRRTNADKRRAVETMLRDPEWVRWPDNRIARQCGVSQPFVSALRSSYNDYKIDADTPRLVERGGKVYEQSTANIGKRSSSDKPVAPRVVDPDELPVIVAPAREPIMHDVAPAPYREGGASAPKPAERLRQAPVTDTAVREAAISARALCGFLDRATMALGEQSYRIESPLLTAADTEQLRGSVESLRSALNDLDERLA